MTETPKLLQGGLSVDDRGEVVFVNDFDFKGVKRFYCVSNHRQGFVRAWHAHKNEAKYVAAINGAALVGAVAIDDWAKPNPKAEVSKFVLSANKPAVLYIPAGYANGFMSLTDGLRLMFFSTSSLAESQGDDYRFDSRLWDIWNVVER